MPVAENSTYDCHAKPYSPASETSKSAAIHPSRVAWLISPASNLLCPNSQGESTTGKVALVVVFNSATVGALKPVP